MSDESDLSPETLRELIQQGEALTADEIVVQAGQTEAAWMTELEDWVKVVLLHLQAREADARTIAELRAEMTRVLAPGGYVDQWRDHAETNRQAFLKVEAALAEKDARIAALEAEVKRRAVVHPVEVRPEFPVRENDSTQYDTFKDKSWMRRALAAEDALAEKDARIAELTVWVNDLQAGLYINCVYCGHRYGPDHETPATMADVLKEHIERCPQHPMSVLKGQLTEARQALAQLRKTLFVCEPIVTHTDEALVTCNRCDGEMTIGAYNDSDGTFAHTETCDWKLALAQTPDPER